MVAIARAAATIVAVAPTLVAKSQESLSVRGMRLFPLGVKAILSHYNDRGGRLVPERFAKVAAVTAARG
ncbi:hypothetical protein MSEO_20950 [Mycobacterium seoulense]|uniref:Uncharacterized protein n=1 Tax=Mycobacterium seoulense TaxID=386911 RepID=A0A7I7NY47_9MYCO|nr:hypothetical protein MSEO_20950 [Mycobacterium seoulense]